MRAHLAHVLLIPAAAVVALPIACGGNVVVDEPAEGTGGGPVTTSTGPTTGTGTTSGTGTGSTTGTGTTSTGTGPSDCDNTGNCGDGGQGCVQCALEGDCAETYNQCVADQSCIDYANCINSCTDDACVQMCVGANPGGQELYNDLVTCVFCKVCMNDCNGVAEGFPGFPGCGF